LKGNVVCWTDTPLPPQITIMGSRTGTFVPLVHMRRAPPPLPPIQFFIGNFLFLKENRKKKLKCEREREREREREKRKRKSIIEKLFFEA